MAAPVNESWSKTNATDDDMNATTMGNDKDDPNVFPTTWKTFRTFYKNLAGKFYQNIGTEFAPVFVEANQDYGDGSDGDVVISVNTDLGSAKPQYGTLTVNPGITLSGDSPFVIRAKKIINNGTIKVNPSTESLMNSISLERFGVPINNGQNGTSNEGGGGGAAGGDLGGSGGFGGDGGDPGGGNGPNIDSATDGFFTFIHSIIGKLNPYNTTGMTGGEGGEGTGVNQTTGGTPGLAGGNLFIIARQIIEDGIFSADGTDGGNGQTIVAGGQTGGGGGGGGGSGGYIYVFTSLLSNTLTFSANGGDGGDGGNGDSVNGGAGGGAGGAGSGGVIILNFFEPITILSPILSVAGGTKGDPGTGFGGSADGDTANNGQAGKTISVEVVS